MAQVQQIYARLFADVDFATSLLLKQDLVDAEFIRERNQRIFTKLVTVQDAALLRSSSQVPTQETELQLLNNKDVSNGPISLRNNDDHDAISQPSFACVSTKSLPLDESGYPADVSTPCSTDLPRTPSCGSANQDTPFRPVLRLRSESFHMLELPVDGVSVRLVANKQYSPRCESFHIPADQLNYRQTSQPLAHNHQDLQSRISRPEQLEHTSPSSGQENCTDQDNCTVQDVHGGQAANVEQDNHFRQDTHVEQESDSEHGTHPKYDVLQERRTHTRQDSLSEQETDSEHDAQPEYGVQPAHDILLERGLCFGRDMRKETLSSSSSFSHDCTTKRTRLRSDAKRIEVDRRLEESHEITSPKATSPIMGFSRSCKRKLHPRQGKQSLEASSHFGHLTQLASKFGSVSIWEEMEGIDETFTKLSEQAQSHILRKAPRQSDLSTIFEMDPGQFIRSLPLLRMRLESHSVSEQIFRARKRIDSAHFYNAYTLAQNNPDTFLQHTAKELFGDEGTAAAKTTGRKSSMVKQRFVDILFSESTFDEPQGTVSRTYKGRVNEQKARKSANQMVEDWRRGGKPWSEMIRRFDYGILLLVPSELTDESVRMMAGLDWSRLIDLIESRKPQFKDLLLQATRMVEKFFLSPASTPAVNLSTGQEQLSLPQSNAVLRESSFSSVPSPDISPLIPDLDKSNTTTLASIRVHRHSPLPPEDSQLEEAPLQPHPQSRIETRISLTSNPELPVGGTYLESVDLDTSTVDLDFSNREHSGSVLTLQESTFHEDLLSPDWLRRDMANSALPTPDWSSGFGFSTI